MLILSKRYEGKTLPALVTGNNARYNKYKTVNIEIVKVNRKTVEVLVEGWHTTQKFRKHENSELYADHIHDNSNGGYQLFDCWDDLEEFVIARESRQSILSLFSNMDKIALLRFAIETLDYKPDDEIKKSLKK